jgi:hypothetical protein
VDPHVRRQILQAWCSLAAVEQMHGSQPSSRSPGEALEFECQQAGAESPMMQKANAYPNLEYIVCAAICWSQLAWQQSQMSLILNQMSQMLWTVPG